MANFTAGTSFSDGVTNDVTAAKLNALVADAVPTSNLALTSTTGTISLFSSGTGTAATPAIQPASDTNTGIFFPAADTIAFSEGGAESMRIDSSGNVGIGNTPSQKLDVNGASAIRGTLFLGDGSSSVIRKLTSSTPLTFANNGGSAEMTIDSSGNVGIGGTPSTLLHLQATSPSLRIQAASGNSGALDFYRTASVNSGQIASESTNALVFSTNGVGNSGLAERLRIDSSGNVGIGTPSPSGPLHIRGAAGRYAFPATSGATQSNGLTLRLNDASDDNAILDIGGNSTSGYWLQATNNANLALNYPLLLNPNGGNVGIGTTTAHKTLTVGSNDATAYISAGGNNVNLTIASIGSSGSVIFKTGGTNGDASTTTERLRISSDGTILFAKNTASVSTVGYRFDANGDSFFSNAASTSAGATLYVYSTGAAAYRFYVGLGGTVNATNTAIAAISDVRLKENIRDIDAGLNEILELKPRTFDWKEGKGANTKNARGFIAQEIEQVFPDLVDEWRDPAPEGEEPYKSVRQDLIPVLVKAIQELKFENDSLKSRIEALEAA